MTTTTQTIEQRVAYLEAELTRISGLLLNANVSEADPLSSNLPFGVFKDDPLFDEVVQKMREERELDADNPAYT
ncbi:hypothetical protein IQ266_21840 [filamentous cyanobacterium LEGE 11480]|uniref:Uncharacterized protein n=1 Tax=Romeriopsis navalis LEGE 11480 TaxID=2777977 RepID=A0A928VUC2_9CYAN|nr:hypothetical protein [Romeriopsis navalis]MBE9032384.1 hypothetical protein [Romeriopsis navalis LEGE 11480]